MAHTGEQEVNKYTFYLEGLGIEMTILAESEKQAAKAIWAKLSDKQRDFLVIMDCVDICEAIA